MKDAQGNRLNLASGAKATINFPIDSNPVHDPGTATVPFWSLDEATGIWVQEGSATRSGSFYTAQVSHFTPYNCDIVLRNQSIKRVEVVGLGGNLVQNAHVILEGTGYRQTGFTGDAGAVDMLATAGDTIRVRAEKGNLRSEETVEVAVPAGQTLINRIELIEPLVIVTMTWAENPWDLDAHMTGPEGVSGRFHVWYGNPGDLIVSPYCNLDTDDVTSFGPEIVTVSKLLPGVYRYSVHNYSGQGTFGIENSGCVVSLVIPQNGIIQRYNVPTSNPGNGNLWVVFELTVDSGGNISVTNVNQFQTADPSGSTVD